MSAELKNKKLKSVKTIHSQEESPANTDAEEVLTDNNAEVSKVKERKRRTASKPRNVKGSTKVKAVAKGAETGSKKTAPKIKSLLPEEEDKGQESWLSEEASALLMDAMRSFSTPSQLWKMLDEQCKDVPFGLDLADLSEACDDLAERHGDFSTVCWHYCQYYYTKLGYQHWEGNSRVEWTSSETPLTLTIPERLLLATLWEAALVIPKELNKEAILTLFHAAAEEFEQILHKLYLEDILQPMNLPLLPRRHRFFHGAYLAFEMLNDHEFQHGEMLLNHCFYWYPSMGHTVMMVLDDLGDVSSTQRDRLAKSEFDMYSMTIKESLDYLITSGRYDEAEHLLASYEELNPSDPEILEYRRDLGLNETLRPLN